VSKLRLIADLMAHGHRPGGLVQLTTAELSSLSAPREHRRGVGIRNIVDDPVLAPLRARDAGALLLMLQDGVHALGAAAFVCERMPRMNLHVGLAWARGELEVYAEHLYTQAVEQVVRAEILARHAAPAMAAPRVLLATFPDEAHGLGLLMAQALLAIEGCPCVSLGVRVPPAQIVAAAAALRADIVGLSFTASMNPAHVLRGLQRLRAELPPGQAMWAGGSSPVLARVRIEGVQPLAHIRDIVPAVAHWRAVHATPA
jgi:methylmalonyl-CoA mutase cobalamin-binding subunit